MTKQTAGRTLGDLLSSIRTEDIAIDEEGRVTIGDLSKLSAIAEEVKRISSEQASQNEPGGMAEELRAGTATNHKCGVNIICPGLE